MPSRRSAMLLPVVLVQIQDIEKRSQQRLKILPIVLDKLRFQPEIPPVPAGNSPSR